MLKRRKRIASEVSSEELLEELYQLNDEQISELSGLYEDVFNQFQVGKIITGKIAGIDNSGVLVDISYSQMDLFLYTNFLSMNLDSLIVVMRLRSC